MEITTTPSAAPAPPRAAIVGAGFIADRHASALRQAGVPLAGVYSRTAASAERAAARWGTRAVAGLDELLELPGLTHLHITAPTTAHAELVRAGLQRGLAIVCEKPLSISGAVAAELRDEAAAAGVDAYLAFNRRFDEGIRTMRRLVAAGEIGDPVTVYGTYQQEWNAAPSSRDWRFDPTQVGPSRVVSEIGSHWLDLAEHVLGDDGLASVTALTQHMGERRFEHGDESGVFTPVNEDAFAALLRFRSGAAGSLLATQLAQGAWDDITLRIDGTAGSIAWDSRQPGKTVVAHKGRGVTSLGSGVESASIDSMIRSIYSGADAECARFADGVQNCAAQDAILQSAASGAWTTVKDYA